VSPKVCDIMPRSLALSQDAGKTLLNLMDGAIVAGLISILLFYFGAQPGLPNRLTLGDGRNKPPWVDEVSANECTTNRCRNSSRIGTNS